MQQTQIQSYLKDRIEHKLYCSFNSLNIPKSLYKSILDNFDIEKMCPKYLAYIKVKLLEKIGEYDPNSITIKVAKLTLSRFNIDRRMQLPFLKEMERLGLIKFKDKRNIILL